MSNFLWSERFQEFKNSDSKCVWDEITDSWRIIVSFMLSLSCTDTISIIKKKLPRTNTIGHSYEII